jgi:hypothetical protein
MSTPKSACLQSRTSGWEDTLTFIDTRYSFILLDALLLLAGKQAFGISRFQLGSHTPTATYLFDALVVSDMSILIGANQSTRVAISGHKCIEFGKRYEESLGSELA